MMMLLPRRTRQQYIGSNISRIDQCSAHKREQYMLAGNTFDRLNINFLDLFHFPFLIDFEMFIVLLSMLIFHSYNLIFSSSVCQLDY